MENKLKGYNVYNRRTLRGKNFIEDCKRACVEQRYSGNNFYVLCHGLRIMREEPTNECKNCGAFIDNIDIK